MILNGKKIIKLAEQLKLIPAPPKNRIELCEKNLDAVTANPVWWCNHAQGLMEFSYDRKQRNYIKAKRIDETKPKMIRMSSAHQPLLSLEFFLFEDRFLVTIEDHQAKVMKVKSITTEGFISKVGAIKNQSIYRLGFLAEPSDSKLFLYDFAPHFLGKDHNRVAPRLYGVHFDNEKFVLKERYNQKQFCSNHPDLCGGEIQFHYFDSSSSCLRFDVFKGSQSNPVKIKECF